MQSAQFHVFSGVVGVRCLVVKFVEGALLVACSSSSVPQIRVEDGAISFAEKGISHEMLEKFLLSRRTSGVTFGALSAQNADLAPCEPKRRPRWRWTRDEGYTRQSMPCASKNTRWKCHLCLNIFCALSIGLLSFTIRSRTREL